MKLRLEGSCLEGSCRPRYDLGCQGTGDGIPAEGPHLEV